MSKLVRRTRPFRLWALCVRVRELCVHTCGDLQTRVCAWCVSTNSCLRLGRWANSLVLQRPFIFIMGRHVDGSGRIWRFYYVIFLFGRFIGISRFSWIFAALFRAHIHRVIRNNFTYPAHKILWHYKILTDLIIHFLAFLYKTRLHNQLPTKIKKVKSKRKTINTQFD